MKELDKYFLQPGYIFVSKEPYLIHTVLGSCVSVCVWDGKNRFGGMNHYIYAKSGKNKNNGRFGDVSVRYLIRLMSEMGSELRDLKAHVVGGARNIELSSKIGDENSSVAMEILDKSGIEIVTTDLGGLSGRKVIFNNVSGEILVYKGINIRENDWYK
jgi:Chemotaxis protein; stimulates methylation of MCP proteins